MVLLPQRSSSAFATLTRRALRSEALSFLRGSGDQDFQARCDVFSKARDLAHHRSGNFFVSAASMVFVGPINLTASFNGAAFSRTRKPKLSIAKTEAPRGVLQWSRVLSNAETVEPVLVPKVIAVLQWSRVLSNAETPLRWSVKYEYRCASMEPRSLERGNLVGRIAIFDGGVTMLQWSRVLSNAETPAVSSPR